MPRPYNFSAGPAMLPEPVLLEVQETLLDWEGQGCSVMEISHRSKPFMAMMETLEDECRSLLSVPDHYQIFFISGPARQQFAMIPMNLMGRTGMADYLNTGIWSKMASEEGEKFGDASIAADGQTSDYTHIPDPTTWDLNPNASFVHYCANETIDGVQFSFVPEVGDVPLAVDMTSSLTTESVDVTKFGIIYAGVQKNLAPAALTIAIVREDLIGHAFPFTPTVLDYKTFSDTQSLFYTPAALSCYVTLLTMRWVGANGGVLAMEKAANEKSQQLYQLIDASDFYINTIEQSSRSRLNVPFQLQNPTLDALFLEEAKKAGMIGLKGHRFKGGMRASLYNAMPAAGVASLMEFMKTFEQQNG